MRRGKFEPRKVINNELTENEQKVLDFRNNHTKGFFIGECEKETGLSMKTVLRHLATIEKWESEKQPPYSDKDYQDAKSQGMDLDNWNDYERYYQLGEQEEEY